MSRKLQVQDCQRYGVKRIKFIFADLWNKVWGTYSLPQVSLISSTKPILSSISLTSLKLEQLRVASGNYKTDDLILSFVADSVKLELLSYRYETIAKPNYVNSKITFAPWFQKQTSG